MSLNTTIHDEYLDSQVAGWLKGFAARVECVRRLSVDNHKIGVLKIGEQYAKVLRCIDSAMRSNGKTVYNLRTSAEKLNTMLCDAELTLRVNSERKESE